MLLHSGFAFEWLCVHVCLFVYFTTQTFLRTISKHFSDFWLKHLDNLTKPFGYHQYKLYRFIISPIHVIHLCVCIYIYTHIRIYWPSTAFTSCVDDCTGAIT